MKKNQSAPPPPAPPRPLVVSRYEDMSPEERRKSASELARKRWDNSAKEERSAHGKYVASFGAGRKRDPKAKRCRCGVMTLKRAVARADKQGTGLGHEPGCNFYRTSA